MDKHLTEGPAGRRPTRSDTRAYAIEAKFLQDSVRDLQTDLHEQMTDLGVSTDQDSLPEGQFESLAKRQRLDKVLLELLQTPERDRHSLETILERRIRQVHEQLSALKQTIEDRKAYDEAFWQIDNERQVLEEILDEWGRWSRDVDVHRRKATD